MRILSLVILSALACKARAEGAEPASILPATGPEYTVDVVINPTQPKPNEDATVKITITPVAPWVVKSTTPMKIALECTDGCSLGKKRLTSEDILDSHSEPKSVSTSVKASNGRHRLDGELSFFLCTEEICKREKDDIVLTFDAS